MSDIKPVTKPVPATMTAGETTTLANVKLVTVTPMVSADGSLCVQSCDVPEQGARKLTQAVTVGHATGLDGKSARRVAASLYRAMLADALIDCGIDSPVLRRAAGRGDK